MRYATLLPILSLTATVALHANQTTARAAEPSVQENLVQDNSVPDNIAQQVPNLQQQLQNGLRATRPDQLQFVTDVVLLVNAGQLPLAMVKGTFQWAREKHADYPFPYFQAALRLRAAGIGVAV